MAKKDRAVNDAYVVFVRGTSRDLGRPRNPPRKVRLQIFRKSHTYAERVKSAMERRYPQARVRIAALRCSDAMRITFR